MQRSTTAPRLETRALSGGLLSVAPPQPASGGALFSAAPPLPAPPLPARLSAVSHNNLGLIPILGWLE